MQTRACIMQRTRASTVCTHARTHARMHACKSTVANAGSPCPPLHSGTPNCNVDVAHMIACPGPRAAALDTPTPLRSLPRSSSSWWRASCTRRGSCGCCGSRGSSSSSSSSCASAEGEAYGAAEGAIIKAAADGVGQQQWQRT